MGMNVLQHDSWTSFGQARQKGASLSFGSNINFVFVALAFELWASCLLGRHSYHLSHSSIPAILILESKFWNCRCSSMLEHLPILCKDLGWISSITHNKVFIHNILKLKTIQEFNKSRTNKLWYHGTQNSYEKDGITAVWSTTDAPQT
jgi:hypothetical protein